VFALDDMDESEDVEALCQICGAGLYTELHAPDCPHADDDLDDLAEEDE
jgi:hypothetical protein